MRFKKYFQNKYKIKMNLDLIISIIESKFEPWMNWNNFNSNNLKQYDPNNSSTWSWNIFFTNNYKNINDLFSANNIYLKKTNVKLRNPSFNSKFEYKNKTWYYFKSKNNNEDNLKYIIDNQEKSYSELYLKTKIKRENIKYFLLTNKTNEAELIYTKRLNRKKEYKKKYYHLKKTTKNSIVASISKRIPSIIKSKKGRSIYLDFSNKELFDHLESLFEPWMNWNNYGKYNAKTWDDNDSSTWTWNIDHIIPHSNFNYTSVNDEDFKKCWNLNNLRPYSAKLNCIEGAKRSRH